MLSAPAFRAEIALRAPAQWIWGRECRAPRCAHPPRAGPRGLRAAPRGEAPPPRSAAASGAEGSHCAPQTLLACCVSFRVRDQEVRLGRLRSESPSARVSLCLALLGRGSSPALGWSLIKWVRGRKRKLKSDCRLGMCKQQFALLGLLNNCRGRLLFAHVSEVFFKKFSFVHICSPSSRWGAGTGSRLHSLLPLALPVPPPLLGAPSLLQKHLSPCLLSSFIFKWSSVSRNAAHGLQFHSWGLRARERWLWKALGRLSPAAGRVSGLQPGWSASSVPLENVAGT